MTAHRTATHRFASALALLFGCLSGSAGAYEAGYQVDNVGAACHASWPDMANRVAINGSAIRNLRSGPANFDNVAVVSCPFNRSQRSNFDRLHAVRVRLYDYEQRPTTCWIEHGRSWSWPMPISSHGHGQVGADALPLGFRPEALTCLLYPGVELDWFALFYLQ